MLRRTWPDARTTFAACLLAALMVTLAAPTDAPASVTHRYFDDASGMSAEAEFDLLDPRTLAIRLRNTSTGVREGARASDQILTAVSWDFGYEGPHFLDPLLTGGRLFTGEQSFSVNFDHRDVGPGEEVSGEWAYSNSNWTGLLQNFISADKEQATPFDGENLDGPIGIEGPAGGLISEEFVPLGHLGAVHDEVIALLTIDRDVPDLGFLEEHGSRIEFGADYLHLNASPAPGAMGLLVMAGLATRRRRRS